MTHAAGLSELRPTTLAEPDVVPLSTFEFVCDGPPGPNTDPHTIVEQAIADHFLTCQQMTPDCLGPVVRAALTDRHDEWASRFIEVEDPVTRRSLRVGQWIDRGDGTWALRVTVPQVEAVDVDGKVVTLHVPVDGFDADALDEIAHAYLDHGAVLVRLSTGASPPVRATVTDPDDETAPGGQE